MSDTAPATLDTARALYADHHGWLHAWLRKKLGNTFDAADLAHDTFLRVLSKPDLPPLAEPRAFLCTVAQGVVANFHRRRKLEAAYLEALAAVPEPLAPSPEDRAILFETLVEIDAMLAGLGAPVRRAFLLSQLDGLGHARIAAQLGVSIATVKRYIVKAVAQCCLLAR